MSSIQNPYVVSRPALCDESTRWMSPELLDNCPRTQQSDIYALGITLAEECWYVLPSLCVTLMMIDILPCLQILTGKLPFPGLVNPGSVISAIIKGQRPPTEPTSRHGNSFKEIWAVASSCWNSDPDERPFADSIAAEMKTPELDVASENVRQTSRQISRPDVVHQITVSICLFWDVNHVAETAAIVRHNLCRR